MMQNLIGDSCLLEQEEKAKLVQQVVQEDAAQARLMSENINQILESRIKPQSTAPDLT